MRKRVLVVDDNKDNRLLETDILEVAGFEVFEAESAQQCLATALRERPNVIVMDIRLPDMRGTEAARILRQNAATRNIPIIFVTASVLKEDRKETEGISNVGFIGKPINTRTFAQEISRYLENSRCSIKTREEKDGT